MLDLNDMGAIKCAGYPRPYFQFLKKNHHRWAAQATLKASTRHCRRSVPTIYF